MINKKKLFVLGIVTYLNFRVRKDKLWKMRDEKLLLNMNYFSNYV